MTGAIFLNFSRPMRISYEDSLTIGAFSLVDAHFFVETFPRVDERTKTKSVVRSGKLDYKIF